MYQRGVPKTIMAKVISAADGSPISTGVEVFHVYGASRTAGTEEVAHVANGWWRYMPSVAECNWEQFGIEFYHTDAVGNGPTVQIFTTSRGEQVGASGTAWGRVEADSTTTVVKLGSMVPGYHDDVGTPAAFVGGMMFFLSGDNAGMARRITAFEGKGSGHWEITVTPALGGAPVTSDECVLVPFGMLLAKPGDEMDLVDAPNATAVTAIQDGLATPADIPGIAIPAAGVLRVQHDEYDGGEL